ncbi:unnamed protein product [Citrullus colocynthis]|uniref:Uncharacterized protein n=1 Tax=Citrullus colocynthis TaxID=252529 RepID=A0ABP0YMA1_9ROSI
MFSPLYHKQYLFDLIYGLIVLVIFITFNNLLNLGTVTTIIFSLCFVIQKLYARAFFFNILALNLLQTEPSLSPVVCLGA